MPKKEDCIAMLLAGGQGSRLGCLTKKIAKPVVPFGGKYKIIDFTLSNCVNSGIDTGVDAVGQREVDDPVLPAIGHGGLGDVFGQDT